jgi:hypothetical protein
MTHTSPVTGEPSPKAALIVAHPGHELRVFHWMEKHKPLYFCITDGSGREGKSRTGSTAKLLEGVGATEGSIFGRYTDLEIYQFLLEGRHEVFADLLRELSQGLIAHDIRVVAGDAPEGANPTHDLCRHLIDNAVAVAERALGHRIANYEFVLDAPPNDCPPELRSSAVWVHLDEAALERKVEAALAYTELRGETEEGLKYYGKKAFAIECLIPSTTRSAVEKFEHEAPAYERYGREGVERFGKSFGKYDEVITFQKHVKPAVRVIEEASRDFAPAT